MPDDRVTLPIERQTFAEQAGVLQAAFGIEGRLSFVESELGGVVANVTTSGSESVIALQGAQLLSWIPRGQSEVFWLSPAARLGDGKAVRGGIPVCWPWFGAHPTDPSKPSHGVARTALWDVAGSSVTDGCVSVKFRLSSPPSTAVGLSVELEATFGTDLCMELHTRNDTGSLVHLTQALHSYFAVGDIDDVRILGLEDCDYVDALADGRRRKQIGPIFVDEEVDRIYLGVQGSVVVRDHRLSRQIEIHNCGSQSCVVWNPWIAKSERLGDMGEEGYRRMVCVETTNAADDALQLEPGHTHRLRAKIAVQPLS